MNVINENVVILLTNKTFSLYSQLIFTGAAVYLFFIELKHIKKNKNPNPSIATVENIKKGPTFKSQTLYYLPVLFFELYYTFNL